MASPFVRACLWLLGRRWVVYRWFPDPPALQRRLYAVRELDPSFGEDPTRYYTFGGWIWSPFRAVARRMTQVDAAALALVVDGHARRT